MNFLAIIHAMNTVPITSKIAMPKTCLCNPSFGTPRKFLKMHPIIKHTNKTKILHQRNTSKYKMQPKSQQRLSRRIRGKEFKTIKHECDEANKILNELGIEPIHYNATNEPPLNFIMIVGRSVLQHVSKERS